jgi:hypothetical protein
MLLLHGLGVGDAVIWTFFGASCLYSCSVVYIVNTQFEQYELMILLVCADIAYILDISS